MSLNNLSRHLLDLCRCLEALRNPEPSFIQNPLQRETVEDLLHRVTRECIRLSLEKWDLEEASVLSKNGWSLRKIKLSQNSLRQNS